MTQSGTNAYDAVDFLTDLSIIDDPYPYYRYVREKHGPVWIEPQRGVAVVTGLEETMVVYRDPNTFSSCNAATGPFPGLPARPEGDDASDLIEQHRSAMPMYGYMATWDPPEHHAYRSLLTGLFTPRRLKENEAFVRRLADHELDPILERGTCEFISDYTAPFTLLVIADLLGVPEPDLPRFRRWFRNNKGFGDLDKEALQQHLVDTREENTLGFFEATFTSYIEERRRQPRADVLTHLAEITFPDGSMPDITILANEAAFLFAAGQETTARSLAFALKYLADDPGLQRDLRAQHELIPAYVEEVLRLESPVKDHFRMARRTVEVGGVEIPAGTSVMLLIGAINRDPRAFDEPDAMRLDRRNAYEHVAFARGAHSCLGQQLARTEMRVSLERLLHRTTDIAISAAQHGPADDRHFAYEPTSLFRGLTALHLTLTPRR